MLPWADSTTLHCTYMAPPLPSALPTPAARAQCVAQFSRWYGPLPPAERIEWQLGVAARWRLLTAPLYLPPLGMLYI